MISGRRLLPLLLASARLAGREAPAVRTDPEHLVNGSAFLVRVTETHPWRLLDGTFDGRPVFFERDATGTWIGLGGVDFEAAAGPHDLVLAAVAASGPGEKHVVSIPIERVERPKSELSVPRRYVEPNARTRARIARERAIKAAALGVVTPRRLFRGRFTAPVALGTSEEYGVERVFNGKRQSVHLGLDYHAPSGTPVHAVNSGRVVLARDLFYEGRCVGIDHGRGLVTLYLHLSRLDVKEGARVVKGQRLGLSGSSGRATGPHLHLAVRWQGIYLDPISVLALDVPATD
ncbi:MAG TPA: M23 family metallopeptidase [Thermoanaerobaculia bacterium]|nr:M23 family metallopeptidase [Thermoanaerobaculia bacterium]